MSEMPSQAGQVQDAEQAVADAVVAARGTRNVKRGAFWGAVGVGQVLSWTRHVLPVPLGLLVDAPAAVARIAEGRRNVTVNQRAEDLAQLDATNPLVQDVRNASRLRRMGAGLGAGSLAIDAAVAVKLAMVGAAGVAALAASPLVALASLGGVVLGLGWAAYKVRENHVNGRVNAQAASILQRNRR